MPGTVTIYRNYFLPEDIHDGDINYSSTWQDVYEDVSASEAADILNREGLSFAATGNDWAALPDGSYVVNYGTGEAVEVSGHLSGFAPRLVDAIIRKVG
jgi:hypothetical protein